MVASNCRHKLHLYSVRRIDCAVADEGEGDFDVTADFGEWTQDLGQYNIRYAIMAAELEATYNASEVDALSL